MTDDRTHYDGTNRATAGGTGRSGAANASRRAFLSALGAGATAAATGAGLTSTTAAQDGGRTLPWLHREGNEIKDPEGNRVVLHGVNVPDPKRGRPEWGHMHTEDAIELAANAERGWNSRIIRLPMQPQDIGDHGPGAVDTVAFDESQIQSYCETYVDPVVEKCRELGLYVMLDYHRHYPEGPDWDSEGIDTELRTFWNVVAPRYADQSHVILELYNEPNEPYPGAGDPTTGVDVTDPESEQTWLDWRDTAQQWVDLVREHSQDQIIVIGNPRWSQFTYWAPEHEFEGENLAYAGHVYAHENMRPLSTYFGEPSTEVPVFMSEYGWEPGQESPYLVGSREVEGQEFRDLYEEYPTIHTQAWCFDHSWTPNLLEQDYSGEDRSFYVREDWGEWTVDFLADRADLYLPEAPTDAGPVDPGEPDPDPTLSAPSLEVTGVAADFVTVNWSRVDAASGYRLYVDGELEAETIETVATLERDALDQDIEIGVLAYDGDEESDLATTTVTIGSDPEGPCVQAGAENGTTLEDGSTVCDVNGDGAYRDVTGDGSVTNADVTEFFANQHASPWDDRADLFDFTGDDEVSQTDVIALFQYLGSA